jgi:hypothetical protein
VKFSLTHIQQNIEIVPVTMTIFATFVLNHKGVSKFPISQLYPPANMYAVASDHDYLQGHPAVRWLKDANISHISEDEIKYILT